jgi:hypothetical protein
MGNEIELAEKDNTIFLNDYIVIFYMRMRGEKTTSDFITSVLCKTIYKYFIKLGGALT